MELYIEIDHIGKVLEDEFLTPYNLSQNALAKAINVPSDYITDIVYGKRGITAGTDLRLTRLFGLSEGYFLRFQGHIETIHARREIGDELSRIIPITRERKTA
jgi:addiction module HigA family antidote